MKKDLEEMKKIDNEMNRQKASEKNEHQGASDHLHLIVIRRYEKWKKKQWLE